VTLQPEASPKCDAARPCVDPEHDRRAEGRRRKTSRISAERPDSPPGALGRACLPSTPRWRASNFKGAISVNGNRTFNNVFLLDGVDNISYSNSFRGENVQLVQPSIEALQEFKIQTNAYSASTAAAPARCQRDDQVGHQQPARQRLRVPPQRRARRHNFFSNALGAEAEARAQPVRRRGGGPMSRTGRSGSATTKGCATRKASRGSAWCRRPQKKPDCSAQ
jgi:hypothetical protein